MVSLLNSGPELRSNPHRVIARPFLPGETNFGGEPSRVERIVARLAGLSDEAVRRGIQDGERLRSRHRDIEASWQAHAALARRLAPATAGELSDDRRLLLGMTFTQEYAFEGAALCNPSMVPAPGVDPDGGQPFVMSARAIGEGHISSIAFHSGIVEPDGTVRLDPPAQWASNGDRRPGTFDRGHFEERVTELGIRNPLSDRVLRQLEPKFSLSDLELALGDLAASDHPGAVRFETEKALHWLATSNYEVKFPGVPLGERVLSPSGPAESRGMEDARFVRFVDDDGTKSYFATYSAYDGFNVLPQLIETADFETFRIRTLSGSCARSKGMALFPRKIEGDYVALARTDNESTFVMRSNDVRRWDHAEFAFAPMEVWEAVQAGNCGSPIETEAGWLVLMHGVGPMRRYVLSAVLLDIDEPTKVLGRLTEPLLEPPDGDADGYVPNVVYSCGGLATTTHLVVPYGVADSRIAFGSIGLSQVLEAMR